MGKCCSKEDLSEDQKTQRVNSKAIDRRLESEDPSRIPTFVFLGIGGAGKSTFFRVLKAGSGLLTEGDCTKLMVALKSGALSSMQAIAKFFLYNCKTPWTITDDLTELLTADLLTPEVALIIYELSLRPDVKLLVKFKHEVPNLRLSDSCSYLFLHCQRFASPTFALNTEDVAHAPLRTTGMEELILTFRDEISGDTNRVRFVDVGGQRPERKRWLDYLLNVSAVIYVAALNDYVNVLEENGETNRMLESIKLFQVLSGHPEMKNKLWVLMLNKTDAFRDIVKAVPIDVLFDISEATARSCSKASKFIKQEYKKYFKGTNLICHFTCAVEEKNVQQVFADVRNYVVRGFFKDLSMV